jgi:hypothetical protein
MSDNEPRGTLSEQDPIRIQMCPHPQVNGSDGTQFQKKEENAH